MEEARSQIEEIVNRETRAWDMQDVDLLLSIIHPDMVWPWPRTNQSHDPMDWVFLFGRYNRERWRENWRGLFDTHALVHNHRQIKKIEISNEGDGAYAVVDIDTLWRDSEGSDNHWQGRVCKVYTKMPSGDWKLIMHTGALKY